MRRSAAGSLRAFERSFSDEAWGGLAADAIDPNPFFAPWALKPALGRIAGPDVQLVAAYADDGALAALAPFQLRRRYARLPLRHVQTWFGDQLFYGAPLLRSKEPTDAAARLLASLDAAYPAVQFYRFPLLDAKGDAAAALAAAAAATGRAVYISETRRRAMFSAADPSPFPAVSGKHKKEARRLEARLNEMGPVRTISSQSGEAPDEWVNRFLALEMGGWKGEAKTALGADVAHAEFFREAAKAGMARGEVTFHRLDVGERTIAVLVVFRQRQAEFTYKICYDEAFARYSPGATLVKAVSEAFASKPPGPGAFIDSCAQEGHPMIERQWAGRRTIIAYNISRAGIASRTFTRTLEGCEVAVQRLRRARKESREDTP